MLARNTVVVRGGLAFVLFILVFGSAGIGPVAAQTAIMVTIDHSQSIGVSRYAPGISHVDTSLRWGDATAIQSAKAIVAQSARIQNTHIMAWGTNNPWPDPTHANPTNWGGLDFRISMIRETGGEPMITFAQAPWWMKGELQRDGSTKLIPDARGEWGPFTYSQAFTDYRGIRYPAGYVSPQPYAARILDSQMDKWLLLVQRTAERYMAPPYNVRYFMVWNELKGYYNPALNRWDYEIKTGDTSGYNAKHGYTYMYNQVFQRLKQVARNLGIPEDQIKIGGPYIFFKTWADRGAGGFPTTEPALQNKPYGTYDQRDVDVIKYWLQKKVGGDFIAWDGGTKNREGTNLVDPYTASEKFRDQIVWLRSLDPGLYPGANTLPVVQSEWYAFPYGTNDGHQHNSVKAFAAMHFIRAGGWTTMLWGGVNVGDTSINPSLYTNTENRGGGQPMPFATTYQWFKQYFSAGTTLLKVTQSSNDIGVLASPAKTMIVNTKNATLTAVINGVTVSLAPYAVVLIDTPAAAQAPASPAPNPTATPGPNPSSGQVADYFQREVRDGWGTPSEGGAYDVSHPSAFGVNGNNGWMKVPSAGDQVYAMLNGTSFLDADIRIKVKTDRPAGGSPHEVYLLVRDQPGKGHYRIRLALTPEGSVTIFAQKWVAGGNVINLGDPVTVPGLTHAPKAYLWLRAQVTGSSPTTFRIKAWADGQPEPSNWQYTATDSEGVLQAAGSVGILSRLSKTSTSAPVAFAYDEFTVTAP